MRVALFATCLVDNLRPRIGLASARLLQDHGCEVVVPPSQTCCGQPGYNNGDVRGARALARKTITEFEGFDYVVVPSGSCAGMIIQHYPRLFRDEPDWRARAESLAARCHELTHFLSHVLDIRLDRTFEGRVTYHDSCSSLRELGIHGAPRTLLSQMHGLVLLEMKETEVCCGFGGTFSVKFDEISERMASNKTRRVRETGADVLAAADLGCLLNIAGRLRREDGGPRIFHIAELLAGMADGAGIGGPDKA
ncbi:MAG: (Fe-S)-binding protein [Gammaproteobacteria bacterium]|nr:(Fe-S)-binding protein [Gammaproteobacteria bacterium]